LAKAADVRDIGALVPPFRIPGKFWLPIALGTLGGFPTHPWAGWLPEHGYQLRERIENVRVWTREE
jgi:hypothetical protein